MSELSNYSLQLAVQSFSQLSIRANALSVIVQASSLCTVISANRCAFRGAACQYAAIVLTVNFVLLAFCRAFVTPISIKQQGQVFCEALEVNL